MPSTCKPLNLPVKATHSQAVSLFKSMDLPSNQITLDFFLLLGFRKFPAYFVPAKSMVSVLC